MSKLPDFSFANEEIHLDCAGPLDAFVVTEEINPSVHRSLYQVPVGEGS